MNKYLKLYESHSQYVNPEIKPNVSYCRLENEVHYNPYTWADEYLTFVAKENGTFTFTPQNNNVISYSTDNGSTWTQGTSITVSNGDKVMWKGTMTPSTDGIGYFSSTANFDVQGNIMSLISGDSFANTDELTGTYTFKYLFFQCTGLTSAENLILPATTLTKGCYSNMFYGCTGLTTAPELPATTLTQSCYQAMFWSCTSLTVAPELPATTLTPSCYQNLFNGCTNLTTAPELPATTLAGSCYSQMFYRCTSLTVAPELPATTLVSSCYGSMFYGCTNLTTAPELPATTLVNACYNNMFQNCTNLNYIKAMFTTIPSTSYTTNWVSGVAANGTFVKNASATWTTTGVNAVPTGWTVQIASE